jgi:hypothetical protein
MKSRTAALLALLVAGYGLVACSGDDDEAVSEADRNEVTTFGAHVASQPASAPAGRTLSAAERAEVAQRGRVWASAAITAPSVDPEANVITAPPLYFARLQLVSSAAAGDTLAQLQAALDLPTSPAVWAGLMKGISRSISAAPDAVVSGTFLQEASLVGFPGHLAALRLNAVAVADLALEPNLRLEVSDAFAEQAWAWPSAGTFTAPYSDVTGRRSLLTLVRVQGAVTMVDGAGYRIQVLALPGQARLVRITPEDPIGTWDAAMLISALEAAAALAEPTQPGEVVLLSGVQGTSVGLDDTRGLSTAMDPVLANFRRFDGVGGTFLRLGSISASALIDGNELRQGGSQSAQFIYSPLNRNNSGVVVTDGGGDFKDCSGPAADIAPHFLALLRDDGSLAFLARMASLQGAPCGIIFGTP